MREPRIFTGYPLCDAAHLVTHVIIPPHYDADVIRAGLWRREREGAKALRDALTTLFPERRHVPE